MSDEEASGPTSSGRPTNEVLQAGAAALAQAAGDRFFRALVEHFSRDLQVDYAFVGRIDAAHRVHTVAAAAFGKAMDDFSYDLCGSPCEQVVDEDFCHFAGGLAQQFPHDSFLADASIEAYMGMVLRGEDRHPLGLMVLLNQRPFEQPALLRNIFELAAGRAAAELDRQSALTALQESQRFLRGIADALPHTVYLFDLKQQRNLWSNRHMATMLGYSAEQMDALGDDFLFKLLHPQDCDELPELFARWETAQDGEVIETEYRLLHADGSWHWFLGSDMVYERDEHGRVKTIVGATHDITERKLAEQAQRRLEEQMQQAQKLESLGLLAGGIAHDFNNCLTAVQGYAELAAHILPTNSRARPMLDQICRSVNQAAELTQQMLAYTGRASFQKRKMHLDELVREIVSLLRSVVSKKAELVLDLNAAPILADSAQVRQVIMNLIINASDALCDAPGTIRVTTGLFWARTPLPGTASLSAPPGHYSYLEVEDDGCGMEEATVARIFDPFFTTKFTGRGLGLAAVLGIVQSHGGVIDLDSAPGRGTRFRVYLPAYEMELSREEPELARMSITSGGAARVLVVDDEASIRELITGLLDLAGYAVETACDGAEALAIFEERPGTFDAVVLDLTMPRLDGWQLYKLLKQRSPHLPVLLISGYASPVPAGSSDDLPAECFLQKPFAASALIERLQQLVASARGESVTT